MPVEPFRDKHPQLGREVYVAPNAYVVGDVVLGDESSIWHGSVLRGDVGWIRVGRRTNIQDLSVVHVTGDRYNTTIGDEVTVGHRVVIHGCTVHDRALIGMGSVLLDGCEIGEGAVVGAGALVPPNMKVPAGMLALGVPAKVVRPVTEAEGRLGIDGANAYLELKRIYGAKA
jgi:carbonic anhydrase/acetyltransferase-like protein (isoleucine patch superfamily)